MKKIAIVIVNFNGEKDTLDCLKSIEKLQTTNYKLQVIVVDNASKERFKIPSYAKATAGKKDLKVIRNEKNLGFAGGNNVGIRYALEEGADYILILNNDTIVDKNLVYELILVADSEEKIGVVAPKIYFAKGHEFHKDKYKSNELGKIIWYAGGKMDWKNMIGFHTGVDEVDNRQYNKSEQTDFASGCCMLIKSNVLQKIGLFDEQYFLYYEDSDFSERIKKAGFSIMYAPKAIVWHKNAGSAGGSGSALQDYYITRNRMRFGMQHASLRTKIALIRESIQVLFTGRFWQRRGIQDFYLHRFGKGSYII